MRLSNLTKDEAYEAMLKGYKVMHRLYINREYCYTDKSGTIRWENGSTHGKKNDVFWTLSKETGWKIVPEWN